MVTIKEYMDALENPIAISLCEARYAAAHAELVRGERENGIDPMISKGYARNRIADKIVELAFCQWLRERRVPLPGPSIFYLCEDDSIAVSGHRVEVRADVRRWSDARSMPIRHFGLRVPAERLRRPGAAADYYVHCLVDPDFGKAALIGYYEGYAMLSHEARTGVVRQCVAVPVSWLHPMGDLAVILREDHSASNHSASDVSAPGDEEPASLTPACRGVIR